MKIQIVEKIILCIGFVHLSPAAQKLENASKIQGSMPKLCRKFLITHDISRNCPLKHCEKPEDAYEEQLAAGQHEQFMKYCTDKQLDGLDPTMAKHGQVHAR